MANLFGTEQWQEQELTLVRNAVAVGLIADNADFRSYKFVLPTIIENAPQFLDDAYVCSPGQTNINGNPCILYDGYYLSLTGDQGFLVSMGDQAIADSTYPGTDFFSGGNLADQMYGGPGADLLNGNNGNDVLVGGTGDDSISGGDNDDQLYGDYADQPNIVSGLDWQLPAEDTAIAGDDTLDGGDGSDTIFGGPGNDQLTGGPRGNGNTDVLTGGDGSDAFMLTYTASASGGSASSSFWQSFASDYLSGIGTNAVSNGVDKLATNAATEFFESLAGSVLLGGMGTAVGDLIGEGISLLFGMKKAATPQNTGEDVMVVTDFDPREDVLFLPLPTDGGTTLVATAANFGASGEPGSANGQTGWGIEFAKGTSNTIYAEVFLDPDFLSEFGITSNSTATKALIEDVFSSALVIDENGIQNSDAVYAFSTDPSDYSDGALPTVADTPIAFTAESGTENRVYGAFGPLSFVDPSVTSAGIFLAGTNMGDILNVNTGAFAPEDATSSGKLTGETTMVKAFAGDDIIFAGDGIDNIYGGDGNDRIYGIGHEGVETQENFHGEDGDDRIYLGWTSMSALADGGDGNDTVSFVYVNGSVTVDLSTVTTNALTTPNATSTNKTDSLISRYALSNVENVSGTNNDDSITGNASGNVIQGNAGSDTLTGGGGIDLFEEYAAANWNGNQVTDFETGETVVIENFSATDVTFVTPGANGATVLLSGVGSFSLGGTDFDNKNLTVTQSGVHAIVTAPASVAPEQITDGGPATDFDDTIDGSNEADLLIGLGGDDRLNGNAGDDTIQGGRGDDVIRGEDGDDRLDGGSGDDSEVAGNGDDTLIGGSGDDSLDGGNGDDSLLGGSGDDSLRGGNGRDTIAGGAGDDSLDGRSGADTLDGGSGNDLVRGGGGSDVIAGGAGDDSLLAGTGDDRVGGGDGNDVIHGRNGDDDLYGGAGNDILTGDGGDDVLVGGLGNDTMTGGGGDDIFVLAAGDGADRIRDFAAGSDLIGLAGGLSFGDLAFAGSDISAGGETLATLDGVDATTLSEFDFVML